MQANVHAHVVLVFVMQRNQTGEDKCKQNYCLKSLEGTVSRGDLQVLHLSRLCFLERKKILNSYQASLHWGFICVQF